MISRTTIDILRYPIFSKGTFEKHAFLLDRFTRNAAEHLVAKYESAWQILAGYEMDVEWPLLSGPGFSAATHPGADNVFVEAMLGIHNLVYNSDCLYANPRSRIFAISDPPGITTSSRRLFTALDRYLAESDDLPGIINRLNGELRPDESATLSLIHFPSDRPRKVLTFVAGDTFIFHGNAAHRTLVQLNGNWCFMGTPHAFFEMEERELAPGDFFVIASDGILSIKGNAIEKRLEDALWDHIDGSAENFVLRAMTSCNALFEQTVCDRAITRFGGSDNVSLILVYPEGLADTADAESFILGGEVQYRRQQR